MLLVDKFERSARISQAVQPPAGVAARDTAAALCRGWETSKNYRLIMVEPILDDVVGKFSKVSSLKQDARSRGALTSAL